MKRRILNLDKLLRSLENYLHRSLTQDHNGRHKELVTVISGKFAIVD